MPTQLAHKRAKESPAIPDRLYFKIGDVARICELETYVLRFWESQFPQLKPNKSGTGQRLYRRRDVELILEIKRLVHGEGYTISGARQALEQFHHRRNPQGKLALAGGDAGQRMEAVAAAIGRARAGSGRSPVLGLDGSHAAAPPFAWLLFFHPAGALFPSQDGTFRIPCRLFAAVEVMLYGILLGHVASLTFLCDADAKRRWSRCAGRRSTVFYFARARGRFLIRRSMP